MICEVGNHPFSLSDEDRGAYQKFGLEPLPICFPHQHQWRLAFRNDRFLHRRTCDLTGKEIVSMYPQDVPYKIYDREAWHSDQWNALEYGRPIDFTRSFFEQYADLQREVPRLALVNINAENSDYCNSSAGNKNCYLVFGGDFNEDCLYGSLPMFSKNCVDCDWADRCERCYFSSNIEGCYECRFAFNSKGCSNSAFIEDCIGCSECILSFNLRNKSFYIENKPYSKEDYFKKKAELLNGSWNQQNILWKRFLDMRKNRVVKFNHSTNTENSTGDYLFNSKNCLNCFEVLNSQDNAEIIVAFNLKDSFNCDYLGHKTELNTNSISTIGAYDVKCSYWVAESNNIEYGELIHNSSNLFGCIGLRRQEYCILNRKYGKEEFFDLRARLIEHMKTTSEWGRFFHKNCSTFPYNESTASFFFPRSAEQAETEGFRWKQVEEIQKVSKTSGTLPDRIQDVTEKILENPIPCEVTNKPFKITPQEFKFYQEYQIPLPRRSPDERYRNRLSLRNPFMLYSRSCMKCRAPLQTTYAPDRAEKVYCEECYLKEVY